MKLVVTNAFAQYSVGEEITDPQTIQTILDGEQAQFVVKVATSDAPADDAPAGRTGKSGK